MGTGVTPTTVVGQTGQERKLVRWVQNAWRDIQNLYSDWEFLQKTFTTTSIAAGTDTYSAADLGITDWSEWTASERMSVRPWRLFETADGEQSEQVVHFVRYDRFLTIYERGVKPSGRPTNFTIADDQSVVFNVVPDAPMTMTGFYRRLPQELTADGDVPICAARHHQVIQDKALMTLAADEEAAMQYGVWERDYKRRLGRMSSELRPQPRLPRALA